MKNLLIATTALVATATVAAADVKFSGYGRFGAKYTEGAAAVAAVAPGIDADAAKAINEAMSDYNDVIDALAKTYATEIAAATVTAAEKVSGATEIAGTALNANFIDDNGTAGDTSDDTVTALASTVSEADAKTANTALLGIAGDVPAEMTTLTKEIAALNAIKAVNAMSAQEKYNLAEKEALLSMMEAFLAAAGGTPAAAAGSDEITAASRLRLQIDMSAASDNGLSFGARYRIQAEENAGNSANAARFTVSTGGLTVAAGNIGGAIEFMPGIYNYGASAGIGLEGNGFLSLPDVSWDAYDSAGAGATNGVEVIYSAGGMGVHVSSTKDSRTAAHVSYSAGGLTVAVAYQDDSADATNDATILTAGYDAGSAKVGLTYADRDGNKSTVVKASTNMGGVQVYGFVGDRDTGDKNAYGLGLGYDLGGGTSFQAGMASNYDGLTTADAGFLFKF